MNHAIESDGMSGPQGRIHFMLAKPVCEPEEYEYQHDRHKSMAWKPPKANIQAILFVSRMIAGSCLRQILQSRFAPDRIGKRTVLVLKARPLV